MPAMPMIERGVRHMSSDPYVSLPTYPSLPARAHVRLATLLSGILH